MKRRKCHPWPPEAARFAELSLLPHSEAASRLHVENASVRNLLQHDFETQTESEHVRTMLSANPKNFGTCSCSLRPKPSRFELLGPRVNWASSTLNLSSSSSSACAKLQKSKGAPMMSGPIEIIYRRYIYFFFFNLLTYLYVCICI